MEFICENEKIFCSEELADRLNKATLSNDFTLDGMTFIAKIVDYYDGDTVTAVFDYNGSFMQHKVRLFGYDSPEMKPLKTKPDREDEKRAAKIARDALIRKVNGKLVLMKCMHFDKYGRLLANLYTQEGESINSFMIAEGYGTPYSGGKKEVWRPVKKQ